MTGQRVGLWGGDFDVLPRAFFRKFHVQPEIVPQSNSMVPFLRGAVSVASAMHYNEYHKLLEAGLRPEELQVFTLADYGLDFPEDGLYCHERCWRDRADQCAALVRAVQQGWDYALDHEVEALDVVMAYCRRAEVRTSRNHQQWMLRSMAGLIRVRSRRHSRRVGRTVRRRVPGGGPGVAQPGTAGRRAALRGVSSAGADAKERPVKFPLRVKLILAICLPLLAVYLTVLTLDYRSSKREALTQMENYLTEVTAHEAIVLDEQLSSVAQVARSTGQFLQTFAHRESAELERLARANLLAEPQLFGFGVALETPVAGGATERLAPYVCRTADGQGLRSMDITSVAFDYTRSDWYLLPKLLRRPAWTDPYFDEGIGRILMCSYSVPLLRDNEFEGVVVADVSLEHIRRQVSPDTLPRGVPFHHQSHRHVRLPPRGIVRPGRVDLQPRRVASPARAGRPGTSDDRRSTGRGADPGLPDRPAQVVRVCRRAGRRLVAGRHDS